MNKETLNLKLGVIISNETLSGNEKQKQITELFENAHTENVRMRVHGEELNEGKFEELARPMVKYLCENYHPHVTVIITPTSAELLEGLKTIGRVDDYIRD
jgi:hypothetical protein